SIENISKFGQRVTTPSFATTVDKLSGDLKDKSEIASQSKKSADSIDEDLEIPAFIRKKMM
ncbi:MAG TPA: hypothetical protein VGA49_01170, partial [Patescibacteria group bacterium]